MSKKKKDQDNQPQPLATVLDRPCRACGNPCPHELTEYLMSRCMKCGHEWL